MARPKRQLRSVLSLSETRAELSELVRQIATLRKVAITVRGEVKAWLVAPEPKIAKRPLRGSLKIIGNLDDVDTSAMAEESVLRRARRAGLI